MHCQQLQQYCWKQIGWSEIKWIIIGMNIAKFILNLDEQRVFEWRHPWQQQDSSFIKTQPFILLLAWSVISYERWISLSLSQSILSSDEGALECYQKLHANLVLHPVLLFLTEHVRPSFHHDSYQLHKVQMHLTMNIKCVRDNTMSSMITKFLSPISLSPHLGYDWLGNMTFYNSSTITPAMVADWLCCLSIIWNPFPLMPQWVILPPCTCISLFL